MVLGLLLHVASVAIFAQMIMPKRMHELRLYGLTSWEDDLMCEVEQMNTVGPAITAAIELWWIVFKPHVDCPATCMGAKGWKCVLLPADRELLLKKMDPVEQNHDAFLNLIEKQYWFKRIAMRPAILEMFGGDFVMCNKGSGSSFIFRLSPFMTGHDFWDMIVLRCGPHLRDWILELGDVELRANMSLLMQGIHDGFNDAVTPICLKPRNWYGESRASKHIIELAAMM
jgi:hypothetical protein